MLDFVSFLVLAAGSNAFAQAPSACPGFVGGQASQIEADDFYLQRVLSIVRAGGANDVTALGSLVASDARFEIWRGDAAQPTDHGPLGAIRMAQSIRPVRYEARSIMRGPIVFIPDRCDWEVSVFFRSEQAEEGVSVQFSFRDGLLVSAVGHSVTIREGNVR